VNCRALALVYSLGSLGSLGLLSPGVAWAAPQPTAKTTKARAQLPKHPPKKAPPAKKSSPEPRSQTLPRVPTGSEAHEKRVLVLREQLESILHDKVLAHTRVGVIAEQLSDEDVLFSRNADQRFNPASNTKILTTAAAIARLGGDWRYPTALYGPAPDVDGVVTGDVVLRGSSDPSLGAGDLADLAQKLAELGVTRIHGDLLVDRRPIGYDGAGQEGLILNRNTLGVRVMPTEPKHAPVVRAEPPIAGVAIENHATTVKGKRAKLSIDVHRANDRLVIEVRGRIGDQHGTVALTRRVGDGALLCGHTLGALLPDFGVTLDGAVRLGAVDNAEALVEHESIPMADVARISNKPSNNFVADTIYKTLGGVLYGLPATLEKGTRAVSDWLVEEGLAKDSFHLVNGSGLTHENRITPSDLMRLLRTIYFQPDVGPDFLPSLSVGGVDGTLRGRFSGTPGVGLVRAKTGTLTGVSTLSGYVGDKGDVIVFSIMVEGHRWKRTPLVRQAQAQMALAMLRFLRADLPGPEPTRPEPDALHQDGIVNVPMPSPPMSPAEDDDDESEKAEPGEAPDKNGKMHE
jgi:D-alanyl-D-alanine carboxypeptidase/D-alanyl-D-alanine-endopeptidase (penicillin-binding protein 4)